MSKFIATSDLHGNLKNIIPFTQVIDQCLKLAREYNCPFYIGGDVNDTKASVRSEFVGILCKLFYEYEDVKKIILVANHDMNNHHNHEEHSLEFMKSLPNTEVIDTPRVVFNDWYAIPYRHTNAEVLAELKIAKEQGWKKLLMHQGVMGAKQSEYVLDESSITLEDLKDFDRVLTGHYHSHQTLGNVTYFGSPFTVSFAEANVDKFIWLISETHGILNMHPIPTGCRKHIQLEWENQIPEVFPYIPTNSIVKVVLKGTKDFCLSVTKEDVKLKLGIENVALTTEIVTQMKKRIEVQQSGNCVTGST
jgi:DNA repair exonuclease SbcCD nuclease subunit